MEKIITISTGRKILEAFLSLIISFNLAVLLVIIYDPIGLDASSKAHAEGVFYRVVGSIEKLTKFLYQSPEHDSNFGQNNTAMVLVDNKDLDVTDSNWPVPFELHNRAISSILSYKPKAIFVDISFSDARNDSSLKAFAETIHRAHEANIPIYFASLDPFNQQRKILPELAQACAKVIPAYRDNASVNGVESGYLLTHPNPNGSATTEYEKNCGFAGQAIIDSPALALYRQYLSAQDRKLDDTKFEEPMEVFWAAGDVHKVTSRLMECERKTFLNTWSGLWDLFNGRFFADLQQDCPHTPVINVRDLFAAQPDDAEAESMFGGKLVIYAANITGSGDVIVSPTHEGRIAAAYLHAMALDNLLVLGEGYKKVSDRWEYYLLAVLFVVFVTPILLSILYEYNWCKNIVERVCGSIYKLVMFLRILVLVNAISEIIKPALKLFNSIFSCIQSACKSVQITHKGDEYKSIECPNNWCDLLKVFTINLVCYCCSKLKKIAKLIVINAILALFIVFICSLPFYYYGVAPLNWIKFIGFAIAYEVIESRMENAQHIHHFFNWLARLIQKSNGGN